MLEAEKRLNREKRRKSYRKNRERELARLRVIRGDVALGQALRAWRISENMTQKQLRTVMGCCQSKVSRMERGLDPLPERWRREIGLK